MIDARVEKDASWYDTWHAWIILSKPFPFAFLRICLLYSRTHSILGKPTKKGKRSKGSVELQTHIIHISSYLSIESPAATHLSGCYIFPNGDKYGMESSLATTVLTYFSHIIYSNECAIFIIINTCIISTDMP